jgi:hypothetical protein
MEQITRCNKQFVRMRIHALVQDLSALEFMGVPLGQEK